MALRDRGDLVIKALFAVICGLGLYYRFNLFIWLILWPVLATSALWRGRWDERLVTIGMALDLAITPVVHPRSPYMSVNSLAADSAFLLLLINVAVRSPRWWPSWAAAFQLLSVTSHVVFLVNSRIIEFWAYIASMAVWFWMLVLALACGVWDRTVEDWEGGRRRRPRWEGSVILALSFAFVIWHTRAELSAERETHPAPPTRTNPARDALLRLLGE